MALKKKLEAEQKKKEKQELRLNNKQQVIEIDSKKNFFEDLIEKKTIKLVEYDIPVKLDEGIDILWKWLRLYGDKNKQIGGNLNKHKYKNTPKKKSINKIPKRKSKNLKNTPKKKSIKRIPKSKSKNLKIHRKRKV